MGALRRRLWQLLQACKFAYGTTVSAPSKDAVGAGKETRAHQSSGKNKKSRTGGGCPKAGADVNGGIGDDANGCYKAAAAFRGTVHASKGALIGGTVSPHVLLRENGSRGYQPGPLGSRGSCCSQVQHPVPSFKTPTIITTPV